VSSLASRNGVGKRYRAKDGKRPRRKKASRLARPTPRKRIGETELESDAEPPLADLLDANRIQAAKNLAAKYYHKNLMRSIEEDQANADDDEEPSRFVPVDIEGISITDYVLWHRKHSKKVLSRFKIGLADGSFCDWAINEHDYTEEELIAAGLMSAKSRNDYWRHGMLLYPHFDGDDVSHFSQKSPSEPEVRYQSSKSHRRPRLSVLQPERR
jgi:hypothetical protein